MVAHLPSSAKSPQLSLAFSQTVLQLILVIIADEFDDILSPALPLFLCCERAFSKKNCLFSALCQCLSRPGVFQSAGRYRIQVTYFPCSELEQKVPSEEVTAGCKESGTLEWDGQSALGKKTWNSGCIGLVAPGEDKPWICQGKETWEHQEKAARVDSLLNIRANERYLTAESLWGH